MEWKGTGRIFNITATKTKVNKESGEFITELEDIRPASSDDDYETGTGTGNVLDYETNICSWNNKLHYFYD
uniref:Uncharacterized protein n=1 Tax=Megaselia scalaris TaxID=36166 RepID=T1GJX2_MEGSC